MKIKSFPDFIFTFGKNEYTEKLPISNRRVFPVGFPELEKYTKQKKEQKKKQILFISQGQMEIAQIAKNFQKSFQMMNMMLYINCILKNMFRGKEICGSI